MIPEKVNFFKKIFYSSLFKEEVEICRVHSEKQYGKIKFSIELLGKGLCHGILILKPDKID